ncbi:MAG: NAD(P)/FAD-dependent oxidoreductase [Spirochaetes bacterium]|nr:NAD(P)/FAD-dependent oxidoreductase [Spirochaetota bacterium]
MKEDCFDVAVIGAGVSGAAIARKLSLYRLKVTLIEKCEDVSFGVSKANSGIIHAGFHHKPATLKSRLEIEGNLMFEKFQQELQFPFKRVGILVAAFSYEEMKTVEKLYQQGIENNVPLIEICNRERLLELEPKLNSDVSGGLYAPTGGIIEPYRYVFALVESAMKNGVKLFTDFKVIRAGYSGGQYTITSAKGRSLKAKYVINAGGLYADEISSLFKAEKYKIFPRKGEEYLLERNSSGFPNHVIFPVPIKNSKGTLVIPTVEGTMMIGPTAEEIKDKEDVATTPENLEKVFSLAMKMIPSISKREIITSFAGLRPAMEGNDFYIDISKKASHFIQVAGIQSPGLTASPAIAEYVKDLLKKDGLKLVEKRDYDPFLKGAMVVRGRTPEEADKLIKKDSAYGNIVCRCENVSEAEVTEAIEKGHTTMDGIKFYTRAGMGKCQGGFCTYKILHLINQKAGISINKITKRGGRSTIVYDTLSDKNIK